MKRNTSILITWALMTALFTSCSSLRSWFAVNEHKSELPISNPFNGYYDPHRDSSQNMILRSKKGDRSIELEIPGSHEQISDFVIPLSPSLKDPDRSPSSDSLDETYRTKRPTVSDHEITHNFPQGSSEDAGKQREIEQGLNLAPGDQDTPESSTSYLAALDHVKQLYRLARYEAALIEADDLVKQYPTDPKLYEMRGTLLDRLGRRELAIKSWNQALRFNPKNQALRRFIERRTPAEAPK